MIAGATPAAARRLLRDTLQGALACVTPTVLTERRDTIESDFNLTAQLTSRSGHGRLTVTVRRFFALVSEAPGGRRDRWQAQTTAYFYKLDDADGREILSYHWHPSGRSPVTRPHLHLGAGSGTLRSDLQKAHLGTGFVTPVTLLALLIESFAVRPRRADWAAVLEAADHTLAPP